MQHHGNDGIESLSLGSLGRLKARLCSFRRLSGAANWSPRRLSETRLNGLAAASPGKL